jgi:branched-chain amino acid transport system ATP-binding protein
MTAALQTFGLVKRFGGILATDNVSFTLEEGARHALIGPNGAGKTTFVNLLTGVLSASAGRVELQGQDITGLKPQARVARGLARTFQINQLFAALSPLEALAVAAGERHRVGWRPLQGLAASREVQREIAQVSERFGLADVLSEPTDTLPYGKQRLLEIALAFACRPRVLLLDEPAAGVPESERAEILAAVSELPRDVSVLLIEHDMDLVFQFAERISVLVDGALLTEGTPEQVVGDPRVRAVYLGESLDG